MKSTRLLFVLCVLLGQVAIQHSAFAFFSNRFYFEVTKEAVRNAQAVVAGVVKDIDHGRAGTAQVYSTTYTGKYYVATIAVDHVLKGSTAGKIRVTFFTLGNSLDAPMFDSLEVGHRYLLFLVPSGEKTADYHLSEPNGSSLETFGTPPAGIAGAKDFSGHLELELLPLITSTDWVTRVRAIYSVPSLENSTPALLHAVEQETNDVNASVNRAARQVIDRLKR